MAPKSQTRRQRGAGIFNMFRRKNNTAKGPNARTFAEKYAPLRALASPSAQRRLAAKNVAGLQDKLGKAENLITAAKAKNAAYNSLDKEYKDAVADQQTKWTAYTAAKSKVYALLMKRQAASKSIMDRAKGVVKHGFSGLFSRKSYAENVAANLKTAEAKKAALLERSKALATQMEAEKKKREAWAAAIEEENKKANEILKGAATAVANVKPVVAQAVKAANAAPAASGARNPFNNFNNKPANKPGNPFNNFNNTATRRNQLNRLLPSNRSNNSKIFTKFSDKNLEDYLRLNPGNSNLSRVAKKALESRHEDPHSF